MKNQSAAIQKFRSLHESGCFILPNPWDAGSAIYLEHLGFKALASTSAGFAFSKGLPDGPDSVPLDLMLDHLREIVEATSLPVNADFQNGYADKPEDVAANVDLCIKTGVAGLSIEDNSRQTDQPLYDFDLAVERIKAARAAIESSGTEVVLTARCEASLVGDPDPLRTSLERLAAFAAAGADCLYAPGFSKPDEIKQIVEAVAPKAVNVLVSRFNCNLALSQLSDLGVRRISVGSALSCVAWGSFMSAARQIKDSGSFEVLAGAAVAREVNGLFLNKSREAGDL